MTEQFFGKELAARKIDAIPGLLEFDIPVHGDNRGWFKENFQKEKMLPLGFPESFFAEGKLQNNVSFSRKNVLRGLHAEPWDKYISVADEGKVLGTWLELKPKYAFVNYADPSLDIKWENLEEAEVSEADKNHPLLKDVNPLKPEDL